MNQPKPTDDASPPAGVVAYAVWYRAGDLWAETPALVVRTREEAEASAFTRVTPRYEIVPLVRASSRAALVGLLGECLEALTCPDGKDDGHIARSHYCGRCDCVVDRNAPLRARIDAALEGGGS